MRVAIIADWLTTFGGAEHVLREFLTLFPCAPVFTTVARRMQLGPLASTDIRTSALQPWYRIFRRHEILLPWMPRMIEAFDLFGYDVVLSSSHAVAKGVILPPTSAHVCYCHTPMRYAWEMEEQYLDDFRIPKRLRPIVQRMLKRLRRWDLTTAKRVDIFLANSVAVQRRIVETYGRESTVVPPPVDDRFFDRQLSAVSHPPPEHYFFAVGRLVPYKRFDLLIETANAMHFPLRIAGTGTDAARLKRLAGPTVEFLGRVPDVDLPALYCGADALLFPQEEDAGLVLREALACGTPVIAYDAGGARDVVMPGETGVCFARQSMAALRDALERFRTMNFDRKHIRQRAQLFRAAHFREHIATIVHEAQRPLLLSGGGRRWQK